MFRRISRRTFLILAGAASAVGINSKVSLCSEVTPNSTDIIQETIAVNHTREFRGIWVATLFNLDWPSQQGLTAESQQIEFLDILDCLQALSFNALMLQVRPAGDSFYKSDLEPWSHWLTGEQGKAPDPFYDPLEFAISECHKRNIELHAWFNPYRAEKHLQSEGPVDPVAPHIRVTHPEYVYQYGSEQWMDPAAEAVQDLISDVILDVVRRYDVDGVHLDDYFYPYPQYYKSPDPTLGEELERISFPDDQTYQAYRQSGGLLNQADWRRENVNKIIRRLSAEIRETKEHVKFGVSPFGIYRPGQPPGIYADIDTYEMTYSDAKKWLEEGWVDYLGPQLYWTIEAPQQSFLALLNWWTEQNPQQRHIYPGIALYKTQTNDWPITEIQEQVEITRELTPQLSMGNIFFRMGFLKEENVFETFKTKIYPAPALVPVMSWKVKEISVPPPIITEIKDGLLRWKAPNECDIWRWTLYKQMEDDWKLLTIFNSETTETEILPGTYALCSVNRISIESIGVKISVE